MFTARLTHPEMPSLTRSPPPEVTTFSTGACAVVFASSATDLASLASVCASVAVFFNSFNCCCKDSSCRCCSLIRRSSLSIVLASILFSSAATVPVEKSWTASNSTTEIMKEKAFMASPLFDSRGKNASGSGSVYYPNGFISSLLKHPAIGKKLPVVYMLRPSSSAIARRATAEVQNRSR